MNPIISVIVPVYNVEKYLDECLKSIVNQSYKNIEIILVDDGSTDSSLSVCEQWTENDDRIKLTVQQNGGLSKARNTGLSIATGDYVLCVDSDDYIGEKLCEKAVCEIEKTGAQIIGFDITRVDDNKNSLGSIENPRVECTLKGTQALGDLVSGKIHDSACNKIISRQLFEGISFPEGRMFEDLGTMYKLFLKAEKICFIPESFYFYRKRSDSIVGVMSVNALCDLFLMRLSRAEDLAKDYPDIAELCLENTALSALALYDRTLWEKTERDEPIKAQKFLADNKEKILKLKSAKKFSLYYLNITLYNTVRKCKHIIGNIVKKLR